MANESSYITSFLSLRVTISLPCTVFKMLPMNIFMYDFHLIFQVRELHENLLFFEGLHSGPFISNLGRILEKLRGVGI